MTEEELTIMNKKFHDLGRPIWIRISKEIAEISNFNMDNKGASFAVFLASLIFQTIVTSVAVDVAEPGSEKGQAFIDRLYKEALRDTLERWQKPDLKAASSKPS